MPFVYDMCTRQKWTRILYLVSNWETMVKPGRWQNSAGLDGNTSNRRQGDMGAHNLGLPPLPSPNIYMYTVHVQYMYCTFLMKKIKLKICCIIYLINQILAGWRGFSQQIIHRGSYHAASEWQFHFFFCADALHVLLSFKTCNLLIQYKCTVGIPIRQSSRY